MKLFLKIVAAGVSLVVLAMAYSQMQARWDLQERRDRIDQVLADKIARNQAEAARKNKLAEQSYFQALQSERDAEARWKAAKERGKLPGNNTVATDNHTFHGRR